MPAPFDTKIAVLLREDLEPWQRLNVTAFLVSGLGTTVPEVIGEPYEEAPVSWLRHQPQSSGVITRSPP